jgi:hypothetical protein
VAIASRANATLPNASRREEHDSDALVEKQQRDDQRTTNGDHFDSSRT